MKNILNKTLLLLTLSVASVAFVSAETNIEPIAVSPSPVDLVMCTMDAKQCEDGSYVGRVGPECHFAACPAVLVGEDDTSDSTDTEEATNPEAQPCTKEYNPVCGSVDTGVRCVTEPCPTSVEKTFSNTCIAENAQAVILYEGVCETEIEKKLIVVDPVSVPPVVTEQPPISLEEELRLQEEKKEQELILLLSQAANEEERNKILEENKMAVLAASAGEVATVSEQTEARKEVISKKSSEIFSQFDFFSQKLDSVLKKIIAKNTTIQNNEVLVLVENAEKNIALSNTTKAQAWVLFATVADEETKEGAGLKLAQVEKLLQQTKETMHQALATVKQSLDILKAGV